MTDVSRNLPFLIRIGEQLAYPIMVLLRKQPIAGAASIIYLATSPEVEGVGGKYWFHCESISASQAAYNLEDASRLWEVSLQLTGLNIDK
jgi:hypothetical protein